MADWREREDPRVVFHIESLLWLDKLLGRDYGRGALMQAERRYAGFPEMCEVAGVDPSLAGPARLDGPPAGRSAS